MQRIKVKWEDCQHGKPYLRANWKSLLSAVNQMIQKFIGLFSACLGDQHLHMLWEFHRRQMGHLSHIEQFFKKRTPFSHYLYGSVQTFSPVHEQESSIGWVTCAPMKRQGRKGFSLRKNQSKLTLQLGFPQQQLILLD